MRSGFAGCLRPCQNRRRCGATETVTTLLRGRTLTLDDLAGMPDDGHRYDLMDGTLTVLARQLNSPEHELDKFSTAPHRRSKVSVFGG